MRAFTLLKSVGRVMHMTCDMKYSNRTSLHSLLLIDDLSMYTSFTSMLVSRKAACSIAFVLPLYQAHRRKPFLTDGLVRYNQTTRLRRDFMLSNSSARNAPHGHNQP